MRMLPPRSQPPLPLLSRRALLGAGLAAPVVIRPWCLRAQESVDVGLVLAVDVARSVDAVEQALQFAGYAAAFRGPRLAQGIGGGPLGAIAVCLFTWSEWDLQNLLVPWSSGPMPDQGRRALEG